MGIRSKIKVILPEREKELANVGDFGYRFIIVFHLLYYVLNS